MPTLLPKEEEDENIPFLCFTKASSPVHIISVYYSQVPYPLLNLTLVPKASIGLYNTSPRNVSLHTAVWLLTDWSKALLSSVTLPRLVASPATNLALRSLPLHQIVRVRFLKQNASCCSSSSSAVATVVVTIHCTASDLVEMHCHWQCSIRNRNPTCVICQHGCEWTTQLVYTDQQSAFPRSDPKYWSSQPIVGLTDYLN